MTISDTTENALLLLIFNATGWANYADNAATSPQTQIACVCHTADPGDAGTMSTSEAAYSGYARVNVNRNSGGWTVTGGSCSPAANIDFPVSGAAGTTLTHGSVGKTGGGALAYLFSGALSASIAIAAAGVVPRFSTASTFTID